MSLLAVLITPIAMATMIIWQTSSRALAHAARMFAAVAFFLLVVWSINAHEAVTDTSIDCVMCVCVSVMKVTCICRVVISYL